MKSLQGDFHLGQWEVSPSRNALASGRRRLTIKHKSMAVLQRLADADGEVVTRNDLLDSVWPGMEVSDDVLTQSIVELRKAFSDDVKAPQYIETVPKIGFRLIAEVRRTGDEGTSRIRWPAIIVAAALTLLVVGLFQAFRYSDRQRVIDLPDRPSIAVLPFENLSLEPENAYLADGLTEEIRTLLAEVNGLKVIARSSSRVATASDRDAMRVGSRLGVATVLEGTVRRHQDELRITLHLIDTADGSSIWSNKYERVVGDVFALQEEIAAAVLEALQFQVQIVPSRGVPTDTPEAYALYLKGKAASNRFEWVEAEQLLRRALVFDPQFAQAYELLSFIYYSSVGSLYSAAETQVLVGDAARRAADLDAGLAYAQVMYSATLMGPDYRRGSLAAVQAALEKRPSDPGLLEMQTWLLTEMGYLDEALRSAQRYFAVDPLAQLANSHLATAYYSLGQVEDALAVDLFAKEGGDQLNYWTWTFLGMLIAERRDDDAALAMQAWLNRRNFPEPNFAAQLIRDARDPNNGLAALDAAAEKMISNLSSDRSFDWSEEVLSLYLYFGYLDRYFELLMKTEPTDQMWHYAGIHAWRGVVFRHKGYTAHPGFRDLARLLSIDDVWDARGAPDFCSRDNHHWVCF